MDKINAEVARCRKEISDIKSQRRERLKNLDLFVLDNSIRESTVGQIRSHTLRNKILILEQVKKAGIKDIIIASFANMIRVDDNFARYLKARGDDFTYYYSFSEVTEGIMDGRCNTETVPVGLRKNEGFGIPNTIFEVDLANDAIDWEGKFTKDDMCQLLYKWMKYVYDKIIVRMHASLSTYVISLKLWPLLLNASCMWFVFFPCYLQNTDPLVVCLKIRLESPYT